MDSMKSAEMLVRVGMRAGRNEALRSDLRGWMEVCQQTRVLREMLATESDSSHPGHAAQIPHHLG